MKNVYVFFRVVDLSLRSSKRPKQAFTETKYEFLSSWKRMKPFENIDKIQIHFCGKLKTENIQRCSTKFSQIDSEWETMKNILNLE